MRRVKAVAGYTLLELITVIILLGILSVTAVSRFDLDPFETAGFEQELRSALRFAQKFAIVSGCEVEVDVSAAGYALRVRDDADTDGCLAAGDPFNTLLNNPTGGVFSAAPPAGVVVSAANFVYDRQGRPSAGASITVDALTITVEPVTGYVY